MVSYGRTGGVARRGSVLYAILLSFAALACSPASSGQAEIVSPPQAQENVVTFERSAEHVLDALVALLVERGEMSSPVAENWVAQSAATLGRLQPVQLTSESVDVPAAALRGFVHEDQVRFVGEGGGRYYLTIPITPESRAQSSVEVIVTMVATTPTPGPLGGRPVASNGTLEQALLDALRTALG